MAEYIDREKLIKRLHNAEENYKADHDYEVDDDPFSDGILSAMFSVNQIVGTEPTADVIERSTMEILCNEYLSKCNCCDECCAETYCILNSLRTENRDCVNNLITYFTKRNIGDSKEIE